MWTKNTMPGTHAEFALTDAPLTAIVPDPKYVQAVRKRTLVIALAVMLFLIGTSWFFFLKGEIRGATWPEMVVISAAVLGLVPLSDRFHGRNWKTSGLVISEGALMLKHPATVKILDGNPSDPLHVTRNASGTHWLLGFGQQPARHLKVPVAAYPGLLNNLEAAFQKPT